MSGERSGGGGHVQLPGRCAEHGGLMWSNAMGACLLPDDVIRGGCRWEPLDPLTIGLVVYGTVAYDEETEADFVDEPIQVTPGTTVYVDGGAVWDA